MGKYGNVSILKGVGCFCYGRVNRDLTSDRFFICQQIIRQTYSSSSLKTSSSPIRCKPVLKRVYWKNHQSFTTLMQSMTLSACSRTEKKKNCVSHKLSSHNYCRRKNLKELLKAEAATAAQNFLLCRPVKLIRVSWHDGEKGGSRVKFRIYKRLEFRNKFSVKHGARQRDVNYTLSMLERDRWACPRSEMRKLKPSTSTFPSGNSSGRQQSTRAVFVV